MSKSWVVNGNGLFAFVGGQSLNSLAVNFIRVHHWPSSYTAKSQRTTKRVCDRWWHGYWQRWEALLEKIVGATQSKWIAIQDCHWLDSVKPKLHRYLSAHKENNQQYSFFF